MTYKHHALRSALIIALLPGIVCKAIGSAEPALMERTLAAIQDWMVRSPVPWPDAWQRQYVDTIRKVIESHQDTPQYAMRLGILYRGFQPYWEGLKKTLDRSLFEVHCAQIRWYAEHLMGTDLPCEEEKQKVRDQYKDLWNYAASSLLTQFPFLDPNIVQMAKEDYLGECYRKIEAPLLPIFLRPFSQAQKAFGLFISTFQAKYPQAVECLLKDRDVLLTFYDFPAEHWIHLRTTNPIESTFATVRLRTARTKGCGSRATPTWSGVFKLAQCAEGRWHRLHGKELLGEIIEGVKFVDGIKEAAA